MPRFCLVGKKETPPIPVALVEEESHWDGGPRITLRVGGENVLRLTNDGRVVLVSTNQDNLETLRRLTGLEWHHTRNYPTRAVVKIANADGE